MDTSTETNESEPPARRRRGSPADIMIMRGAIDGRVPRQLLHDVATRVCRGERLRGAVHVIVVGDSEMRRLNRSHLHKDRPTDVLTFPLADRGEPRDTGAPIGEIYCNIDHARRWSHATGDTQASELARLIVHGLLHLAGYVHHSRRDQAIMTERENRYLTSAGLIARRLEQTTA